LSVVDSSNSYLLEVRVVFCLVFWDNFWVVWFVVILRSCKLWTPNCVIITSGNDKVREVVWLCLPGTVYEFKGKLVLFFCG
jgi:hypothetical protein